MVAIVTGSGLGLDRSSASVLGSQGQVGSANFGWGGEQVYVNAATGNLVIQNRDEFLVGLGPDIAITRAYNSLGTGTDDNGDNWLPGLTRTVAGLTGTRNTAGSTVTRTNWDGSQIVYTWNATANAYLATDGGGAYDTITYASGVWTWTDGNSRIAELYDEANGGRITSSRDTDGNALTYTYTNGNLTRVTNANGEYTDLVYSSGRLVNLTTSSPTAAIMSIQYGYDSSGRLNKVSVDHTPLDSSVTDGNAYVTTYTYDGSSDRIASITQPDGSTLQIAYTFTGGAYRVQTLTQVIATGDTRVTSFSYNTTTRTTTITDPLNNATKLVYDTSERLIRIEAPAAVSGGSAQITQFSYNANGDVATVTDPSNNVTTYSYDSHGNVTRIVDAHGNTIDRTYGTSNELLTETRYLVPDPDGAGSGVASSPVTSRFVYDAELHLRFVVSGDGGVSEYRYDTAGQVVTAVRYTAHAYDTSALAASASISESTLVAWIGELADKSAVLRTDTTYDFRGNVATVTTFSEVDSAGVGLTTKPYSQTTYVYNQDGTLYTRQTRQSPNQEIFVYDGLGRITLSRDLAGWDTTIAYNDASGTTTVTLANGLTKVSTYNKAGELISYTVGGGDAANATSSYKYDKQGNVRMVSDPTGRKTYYLYDNVGRKVADIAADGSVTEYRYDASNRLTTVISWYNKANMALVADGSGNPLNPTIASIRPTADSARDLWQWRVYDKANRVIETIDSAGSAMVFTYDGLSRLVSTTAYANAVSNVATLKTTAPTALVLPTADSTRDHFARNFYDNDGRLVGTMNGTGSFVQYFYDEAGQKIREIAYYKAVDVNLRNAGTFDQLVANVGTNAGDRRVDFVYDRRGDLRYRIDANQRVTGYVYNSVGQVLRTIDYSQAIVQAAEYSYSYVDDQVNGVFVPPPPAPPPPPPPPQNSPNPDIDGDGVVNHKDHDLDGDGIKNSVDDDVDGDGIYNNLDADIDGDGTANASDATPNGEPDSDLDGIIDAQDSDIDNDGVANASDNDRDNDGVVNSKDYDLDGDGIGYSDDKDRDGDGIGNKYDDDIDGDGVLNGSDASPNGEPDLDGDGISDFDDWDRDGDGIRNRTDWDADNDGIIDYKDKDEGRGSLGMPVPPPAPFNPDIDGDGVLNTKDYDIDGDGKWNHSQDAGTYDDMDGDGVYNSVDTDKDGDGIANAADSTPNGEPDFDGDGIADINDSDIDNDGIANASDNDWDNDGIENAKDYDLDGDGTPNHRDVDLDGDGILNELDGNDDGDPPYTDSDNTRLGNSAHDYYGDGKSDIDGDGQSDQADSDRDGDGISNYSDSDDDGDGILDAEEPDGGAGIGWTRNVNPDVDGDGVVNTKDYDIDGDGISNANETDDEDDLDGDGVINRYDADIDADGKFNDNDGDSNDYGVPDFDGDGTVDSQDSDRDGDGIANSSDTDDDGDTILDSEDPDFGQGTSLGAGPPAPPPSPDIDGDGYLNTADYDIDGDGDPNTHDQDIDGDGLLNGDDPDMDGDRIHNSTDQTKYGQPVVVNNNDLDGDNIPNSWDPDIDGDGVANTKDYDIDGDMVANHLDGDFDGDGIQNSQDDPYQEPDFDGDGIRDSIDDDRDGDGITNRRDEDDDGDGIKDWNDPDGGSGTTLGTAPPPPPPPPPNGHTTKGLPVGRYSRSVYDAVGRLAYSIEANGATTAYQYDRVGNLIGTLRFSTLYTGTSNASFASMEAWAAGQPSPYQYSRLIYDTAGRLIYEVDAEGYVTEHQYDAAGRVLKDIRYAGQYSVNRETTKAQLASAIGTTPPGAATTSYEYDVVGRLWKRTDQIDDTAVTVTRYLYDALGQVDEVAVAFGTADESITKYVYDAAGRLVQETHGYGTAEASTTAYVYDALDQLKQVTTAYGTAEASTTERSYDTAGRLTKEVRAFGTADASTTEYTYNSLGLLAKVRDPLLNDSFRYYDAYGRLILEIDAEGYATQTAYDIYGQVASVTRVMTKTTGTPAITAPPTVTADAAIDHVTRFEYDKLGRVVKTIDAEGKYEEYGYDAFGNRISVRNKLGGTILNSFDRRGLLLTETLPMSSHNIEGVAVATSVTNRFEYDARGNRTKMVEADGLSEARTTIYVYDRLDRLIETRGDLLTVVDQSNHRSTSNVTPTETIRYDRRGNVIETIAANGARTLFYYDDLGRKTAELGPLGQFTTYTYDAAGNLRTSRVYATAVALPPTAGGTAPSAPAGDYRETVFTYDKLGRLKTSSVAGIRAGTWNGSAYSSSVVTVTTSHDYDAAGNLIKTTDGAGGLTFYYYDKLGRKKAQVDAEKYLTTWDLDAEGNVKTERRYATRAGTVTTGSVPSVATHADDRVTNFAYDRNGRRLSEQRLNVVAYTVSAGGVLTQASTTATIWYEYNGLGQVTKRTESTGDFVNYTYDQTGRLTKEARRAYMGHDNANVTPTLDYYYNGVNALVRTRQGAAAAAAGDRITRYTYGAGGRMASMTNAAGDVFTYQYDVAGNLVLERYTRKKADNSTTQEGILKTFDLLGRVTSQTIGTDTGSAWVKGTVQGTRYNVYGEVSERGIWEGTTEKWQEQLFYDKAGRLWRTNAGDGVWRHFFYDANGNQTLAVESLGRDFSSAATTEADVLTVANGVIGGTITDANVTLGLFDKRGQQTGTVEPRRQVDGATPTLSYARTYNAFGDVTSETNARGHTTEFFYNAMGRLIEKKSPQVSWTDESGVAHHNVHPVEKFFYDLSGRLVGNEDANGNRTTRLLLAGTGYNGTEALVTDEFRPGTADEIEYDVFGDARIVEQGGVGDSRTYDAMGRLITHVHRGLLLTDSYVYDVLGQRIRHSDNVHGDAEITDYDRQGRIIRQVAFGGDETTTSYSWSGTLETTGLGTTLGGWTETTTYANGKTMVAASDIAGREVSKTDLGGHAYSSAFDRGGRLITRSSATETLTYAYYNTGLIASITSSTNDSATYTYDAGGNRLTEVSVRDGATIQNATATYDALDRMVSWDEAGGTTSPTASIDFEYDLNGNIRRKNSSYRVVSETGGTSTTKSTDYWYRYDALNRVVVDKGQLSGGVISRRTAINDDYAIAGDTNPFEGGGVDYTYDSAGRRKTATWTVSTQGVSTVMLETYHYRDDGTLQSVTISKNGGTAQTRATYVYDALGRLTDQTDWIGNGTDAAYDRTVTYNAKGQIATDDTYTKRDGDIFRSYTVNNYGSGASYALGAVTHATTQSYKNGSLESTATTNTTYGWYEGAVQTYVSHQRDIGTGSWTANYYYDVWGTQYQADVNDGRARDVYYTNDMNGQVLKRREVDNQLSYGDPNEIWYRFNGRQLGYTGNNGTAASDYDSSILYRQHNIGQYAFRFNKDDHTPYADFSQATDPINSYMQGSDGGSYTVRAGDTLASIAQEVWGDASLWYKIAETNGLSPTSPLIEGQRLNLPSGVTKNTHNADTYKPYDPAEAIGEAAPTQRKPKKKNWLGMVLLAVIAAAVVAITAGVAIAALAPASAGITGISSALGALATGATKLSAAALIGIGAGASAAGSIVSQGVGVATGLQDKFSFKGVAMAAVAGGIGAAVGPGGLFGQAGLLGNIGSPLATNVLRGASASLATQGIGVALGLQRKFDWAGVAAAGVGAGVGGVMSRHVVNGSNIFEGAAGITASSIANAATRSAFKGTNFGDSLMAALPDAAGQLASFIVANGFGASRRQPGEGTPRAAEQAQQLGLEYDPNGPKGGPDLVYEGGPWDGMEPEGSVPLGELHKWMGLEVGIPNGDNTAHTEIVTQELIDRLMIARAARFGSEMQEVLAAEPSTLDSVRDTLSGWTDSAHSWSQSAVDGWDAATSGLMGTPDGQKAALIGDFLVGAIHTIVDGVTSIPRTIAHPTEPFRAIAGWLDRAFLDDRPASKVVSDSVHAIRHANPRSVARGAGSVAAGVAAAATGRPVLGRAGNGRALVAAERNILANMADGPAFGGTLYPPERLQRLVGYLERRNVSVFGTEGNPGFMARADGTGQMLLPENPTVLQVKHELSHYLDFRRMGFEAYRDMGRPGRESSVLERLQANRSWSTYTDAERQFSIDYVNRLRGR